MELIIRVGFKVINNNNNLSANSFEYLDLTISHNNENIRLVTIYRPPPSNINRSTVNMFLEEFSSLLEVLTLSKCPLLICGDFNFYVDDPESTDLDQLVVGPIHRPGHTLDLILTREDENLVSAIQVSSLDNISDHKLITCTLDCSRPPPSVLSINCRNMKNINMNCFVADIRSSTLFTVPKTNACDMIAQYNAELSSLLDKHAPVKRQTATLRPNAPWYDEALRDVKQIKTSS